MGEEGTGKLLLACPSDTLAKRGGNKRKVSEREGNHPPERSEGGAKRSEAKSCTRERSECGKMGIPFHYTLRA
jgi:hypothetical protein